MAVLERYFFSVAVLFTCAGALIIPQELPTILSVIYANIPPILKGTDSRLGVGFRFGPHADFQLQLELGPQLYTQPLGPDAQQRTRRGQATRRPVLHSAEGDVNSPGGKWISSWRSGLINPAMNSVVDTVVKDADLAEGPTKEQQEVVSHLRQLYKKNDTSD